MANVTQEAERKLQGGRCTWWLGKGVLLGTGLCFYSQLCGSHRTSREIQFWA